jgi:hypothetical protein
MLLRINYWSYHSNYHRRIIANADRRHLPGVLL